jgi:4-carboxymuconolactone decarboxylase
VLAARAGVSAASIEAIRTGKAPEALTEPEQVIARVVHQLLRQKDVSEDLFAAAQELVGTRGVVDLALTCSYYTAVCLAQLMLKPEMEPGRVSTL